MGTRLTSIVVIASQMMHHTHDYERTQEQQRIEIERQTHKMEWRNGRKME